METVVIWGLMVLYQGGAIWGGICQNCNAFVACLERKIRSGEELYVTGATAHLWDLRA